MPNYQQITEILKAGGVILYPTDTVWGIGCDATNASAVARIFTIKQRSESKSLIILVSSITMLRDYIADLPQNILNYLQKVTEPTTIIYENPQLLAPNVIAADNTVAIRLVQDPFCQQMIAYFGKPIVSTSANISGQPTPLCFADIPVTLIEHCDYVVPYRQDDTAPKKPSRIIKFDKNGELIILR